MSLEVENQKETGVSRVMVIEPDSRFGAGPLTSAKQILIELTNFRSHIFTLFSNDFRSSYRGTNIGVAWNFILPLIPVSVYLLLVNLRVFPSYDGMEPALFLAFNVMIWYFVTGLILTPINVVKSKAATAMKTSLPLSVAIASSFAQLCFDTLVRVGLVIVLIVFFQDWPVPHILGFVSVIVTALLFSFSCGLILSIVNMAHSDTQRIIAILLQYGLFLSGVIFPMSSMGRLADFEPWHPLAVFVGAARQYLFEGGYAYPTAVIGWAITSVILFIVGVRFFYTMEQRVRGLS